MFNIGFKLTFIMLRKPLHIILTTDTAINFIENILDVLYAWESIKMGAQIPVFSNIKITFNISYV